METVTDALRLIEAARKGVIPMYDDSKLESSGRVGFVWSGDVFVSWTRRSGTFDWVDGLSWSKPHSADLFLVGTLSFVGINARTRMVAACL